MAAQHTIAAQSPTSTAPTCAGATMVETSNKLQSLAKPTSGAGPSLRVRALPGTGWPSTKSAHVALHVLLDNEDTFAAT
jgi:hypothetical protein